MKIISYHNIFSKNFLVYALHDKQLSHSINQYAHGKLLDIGCGSKQYESMISPFATEHIGLDHENTLHDKSKIDLFGTAYNIPVDTNYFDTILCTAVLEHLEEPNKAIEEAYRVLKADGYAIYTVPFFWHLHEEPRDFYRFTKYGLKYLFEKNGFEIIELKPLSGFWVTFGQEFVYYLWRFRLGGKLNPFWWIIPIIGAFVQCLSYLLDKIDHPEGFTWMYIVVARKKS